MSLMKRELSASCINLSLSSGSPSLVQSTSGAGVPDASQMRVVGWPADVKTLGEATFNTGAEGWKMYSTDEDTLLMVMGGGG